MPIEKATYTAIYHKREEDKFVLHVHAGTGRVEYELSSLALEDLAHDIAKALAFKLRLVQDAPSRDAPANIGEQDGREASR